MIFKKGFSLRSRKKQADGFTMVECIAALAVLGISLAAVFQTIYISARSNRFAREISAASYLANAFLEDVRRRATAWNPKLASQEPLFQNTPGALWQHVFPDLPLKNDPVPPPIPWCDNTKQFCPITTFLDNPDFTTLPGWKDTKTGQWLLDEQGRLKDPVAQDINRRFILEYRAQLLGLTTSPNASNEVVRLTLRVSWSNKDQGETASKDYYGTADEWNRRMVLLDTMVTGGGGYLTTFQGT
ncbi:MAG: type II secretion system protein [Deltaproteobacteria bacterium]|nr:type II secretion system protein [Deltaproteobacteria bacterium]